MTPKQQDHNNDKKKFLARHGLAVFASLYTFVFVGALFGWGPMQRLLEGSGAFANYCTTMTPSSSTGTTATTTTTTTTTTATSASDGEVACPAQRQILVNMGFLATTLSIVTPIIGHAIDEYGASVVSYGMSLCAMLGSGLLVVAATYHNISWLYWIAFALLGLTTFTGSLLSVQVGLYFQGRTQVRIIMWLNTLFDAGSVSYLFLWMIQEYFHVTFATVATLYFFASVLLFVPASYLWTVAVPQTEHQEDQPLSITAEMERLQQQEQHYGATVLDGAESETTAPVSTSLRFFMESKMDYSLLKDVVTSRRGSLATSSSTTSATLSGQQQYPPSVMYGSIREEVLPEDETEEEHTDDDDDDYFLLSERSANEQLLSLPFIMLNIFFSLSMISCNWSLITAADFLAGLGDDGTYLKIFTLMQPASILALPLVDWIVQTYGFGVAFQAVNAINFVYIMIKCTSTSLHLQVVTFLMVAAVRCFLYATTFSFLPSLLSADVVGRGTGFLAMVGGVASFMNIPLNGLAGVQGDFFLPNLIYLFAVVPCTVAAGRVHRVIVKEARVKLQRDSRKNGGLVRSKL